MSIFTKSKSKSQVILNLICIVFIVIALFFFFNNNLIHNYSIMNFSNGIYFFSIAYIISHILRILRLYILLLESKVRFKDLIIVYFTSSWISFMIPYKVGEIIRITEIARLTDGIRKGIVTIWIERFFDAVVLTSLIFGYLFIDSSILYGMPVIIVLISFVTFSILFFLEFVNSYIYLTNFFISKSNTYKGIKILKWLYFLKEIHNDIKTLINGRKTILLLFSMLVWAFELSAIYFLMSSVENDSILKSFLILLNQSLTSNLVPDMVDFILIYKGAAFITLSIVSLPLVIIKILRILFETRINRKNQQINQKYIQLEKNIWLNDSL